MNKFIPLPRRFYEPSAAVVAPRLLGHWLVHRTPQGVCAGAIVETEAFVVGAAGCHAFRAATRATKVMFAPQRCHYDFIWRAARMCRCACRNQGCMPPNPG